jgi:hypothetical protein
VVDDEQGALADRAVRQPSYLPGGRSRSAVRAECDQSLGLLGRLGNAGATVDTRRQRSE